MRERMGRLAGTASHDVAGLLARFGSDVAGAVQVFGPRAPWEPPRPRLRDLDDAALAQLLDEVALGNDPVAGKTSLAGVQPKIVLAAADGQWFQPLGGAVSTHLIKPATARPEALAEEEYGQRLAARLGLSPTTPTLQWVGGRECLVIERYDRDAHGGRLHQEDFNQALGLSGDEKYQEIGGHARLARVADVLSRHAPADLDRLAAHVTLAVAIGNLDLHAKNLALLHRPDGGTTLAPAYDMVPLAHVPGVDGRLAMAVHGEYVLAAVTRAHLEREVATWGGDPDRVRATLESLLGILQDESPLAGARPLREILARGTERLLAGTSRGEDR